MSEYEATTPAASRERTNPTQFELPGMPVPLYPCTPTRLVTWRGCRRRYRFSYLDRPQPPKGAPWAHNSVGAAVHSALADWFTQPAAARTPEQGARLVRRRWLRDGFAGDAQSVRAREVAAGWVRDYLGNLTPATEPVGVERGVSVRTATLALSGRADRIDRRELRGRDELVIVDYKTGQHVPTPDDARGSLALATYALAAAATLRTPCARVELHHLPSATVVVAEHSPTGLAELITRAEATGAEAAAADGAYRRGRNGDEVFPPAPGPGCSWCDFRKHCPEGRAAAPEREAWSGLNEALIGN